MTQQPSGWYDDPDDDSQLRYFDGILWTPRTMPKLRPGLEHVGEARPEAELPRHEEPHRRAGQPRTYPAHWGPETQQNPDSPFPHHVTMPIAGQRTGEIAGLGQRFVANIIDRIVVSLVVAVGFLVFGGDTPQLMQQWMQDLITAMQDGATQTPQMPGPLQTAMTVLAIATAVVGTLYDAIMTNRCHGRTLGRMALGIAVVPAAVPTEASPDSSVRTRVPFARALVRSLIKWGPEAIDGFGVLIQLVVFFSALGNARRAGLHDRAAGTEVRRVR